MAVTGRPNSRCISSAAPQQATGIGRGHDVRGADRHQLGIAEDVLHAVLAEDAVAQLGDDDVGLGAGETVEDALRGGDGDAGVGAGDADVVEGERGDGAGVEHRERVAHQRDAGELRGGDPQPAARQRRAPARWRRRSCRRSCRCRRHRRRAPGSPARRPGGTARSRMCAGRPTRSPSSGKARMAPEHLRPEGRADVGIDRGAATQDPAQVEHLDRVADGQVRGHHAGVAPQRPAGAEHAGERRRPRGARASGR